VKGKRRKKKVPSFLINATKIQVLKFTLSTEKKESYDPSIKSMTSSPLSIVGARIFFLCIFVEKAKETKRA